jgi:hypothetical protein
VEWKKNMEKLVVLGRLARTSFCVFSDLLVIFLAGGFASAVLIIRWGKKRNMNLGGGCEPDYSRGVTTMK